MIENDVPATAITDPALFADDAKLHGMLARLRRIDPFPYVEAEGHLPFWLATRHSTITKIELDPVRFISAPRQVLFSLAHIERSQKLLGNLPPSTRMRNVTAMDGADHRVYRAITQSHFLSKALNSIRDDVDAIAKEFVGRMDNGTGPHLCLGQHLAKMELTAFLREFLAHIDDVELAGEPRRVQSTFVGGVKRLPIRYRYC